MPEIFVVMIKGNMISMMLIHHGSNPVKPEAVEVKLLHPVFYAGQQKLKHFGFSVIKKF